MAPPKTVLDKIVHAVTKMADPTGSSRVAIVKFLKREFDLDNANDIRNDVNHTHDINNSYDHPDSEQSAAVAKSNTPALCWQRKAKQRSQPGI